MGQKLEAVARHVESLPDMKIVPGDGFGLFKIEYERPVERGNARLLAKTDIGDHYAEIEAGMLCFVVPSGDEFEVEEGHWVAPLGSIKYARASD